MIADDEVRQILYAGICKYAKEYDEPAKNVQLIFLLNSKQNLMIKTCTDQKPKEEIKMRHLIGRNIYNFKVEGYIKRLLCRLADEQKMNRMDMMLMAVNTAGDTIQVYMAGREQGFIRWLNNGELKI